MGTGKEAVSFDQIIKAGKRSVEFLWCISANPGLRTDRQRRKNEALANEILGKGRRASAPGSGLGNRKQPSGPSLASRIGVAKVQSSTSSRSDLFSDHSVTSDLVLIIEFLHLALYFSSQAQAQCKRHLGSRPPPHEQSTCLSRFTTTTNQFDCSYNERQPPLRCPPDRFSLEWHEQPGDSTWSRKWNQHPWASWPLCCCRKQLCAGNYRCRYRVRHDANRGRDDKL